ncbi:hypothetical protein KGF57_004132 [Candida theae]|uniref:Uncharacterized protein n=1 Tax=Candida theae TaxID=1198502 RepID=A0AAD5FXE9_9ASCO|nr:uncharacterized protein KGF57_004132 [Candida theae]KAI5952926.1 hypothetical protein KGF57_004132 [Candida theae]
MTSVKTIENIVKVYESEIHQLNLPDLLTLNEFSPVNDTSTREIAPSPYIAQYKLQILQSSLLQQLSLLDQFKKNKSYKELKLRVEQLLVDVIDEKLYVVHQLIEWYNLANTPQRESTSDSIHDGSNSNSNSNSNSDDAVPTTTTTFDNDENLTELRNRLLSKSKSKLDLDSTSPNDVDKLNTYHESIQDDILNELSQLTSTLKTSAMSLSSKILGDDLSILNETNENIIRNSNLFKVIDRNLNNYLESKTGNRISLWFLLKCVVGVIGVFLLMMLFIVIVPRIR